VIQGPSRSGQASAAAACTPRHHLLHSCAGRAPTLLPHGLLGTASRHLTFRITTSGQRPARASARVRCTLQISTGTKPRWCRLAGRVAATMRVWETLTLALLCPRVRRYKRPTSLIVHPSIAGRILFNGEHRPHPPLFSPARPTVASSPRC
jgi:hypothetical protein